MTWPGSSGTPSEWGSSRPTCRAVAPRARPEFIPLSVDPRAHDPRPRPLPQRFPQGLVTDRLASYMPSASRVFVVNFGNSLMAMRALRWHHAVAGGFRAFWRYDPVPLLGAPGGEAVRAGLGGPRATFRNGVGMATIRILLIDNNPQFLKAMRQLLAADEEFEIVGGTYSATKGLELVARLRPDVVVVDLAMPLMNGLEATRRIKAGPSAPLVIIVTLHDQEAYWRTAEAAGADGFVPKWDVGAQLPPMIRRLLQARRNQPAQGQPASTGLVRE